MRQLQDEGIQVRRQTIARILKKFKENGTLSDKTATGRRPILTMEQMEENDELTAIGKDLLQAIAELILLFYPYVKCSL